jgi:glucosyl-3-phosphoglycerate synthase
MDAHHDDPRPHALAEAKARLGVSVSVCLPARNEEPTVGHIVATVRRELVEAVPLVDEVVVLDDGSIDGTAEAARWEGAVVHAVNDVLPAAGPGQGKGNALWKSLYVTQGDLICWVDADVRNFKSHFVTRLLAPLFEDPAVGFVKAYYRRPLETQPSGGGRVTELLARPVLCALFPHLSHIVQPLAGEYAGRRTLLERVPFVSGWGVELGLLVDLAEEFGVDVIAQCDLDVREHRNRPLHELSPPAMEILLTALRRAGIAPNVISNTLVRFDDGRRTPRPIAVDVRERPPMLSIPDYRAKFGRERTA